MNERKKKTGQESPRQTDRLEEVGVLGQKQVCHFRIRVTQFVQSNASLLL